jgi:hypothetical protein
MVDDGRYILAVKGELKKAIYAFIKKNKEKFEEFWEEWEESEGDMEEFTPDNIVESLMKDARIFADNPLEDAGIAGELKCLEEEVELAKAGKIISNRTEKDLIRLKVYNVSLDPSEYPTYLIEPLFIEAMDSTENPDFYFNHKFLDF